jgi:integrase
VTDRNHNLRQRHQGWFLQINIPPDVRHAFLSANGKIRERIIESLHTRDVVEARELRDIRLGEWRTRFAQARAGVTLSAEDIAAEVDRYRLRSSGLTSAHDEVIAELFGKTIADIATRLGKQITPGTPAWRALGLALMKAQREDQYNDAVEAIGELPAPLAATTEASPAAPLPVRVAGGTPFSVTAAKYLDELQRDKSARLKEATYAQYQTTFRLFRDFTDDRPLTDVDHKTASGFLDAVASLDSTWGKHADAKTRTLAQLLELFGGADTGRPKLSNQSINRHCRTLKALYKWAQSRGDVNIEGKNPFADRHRKRGKANGWLPYTTDELNKLFAAPLFQVPRAERIRPKQFGFDNALRWAPLIALFTGMRIEEVCQLQVADLKRESGTWFFNVVEGTDQSLKTENATRRVPVHDALVALGLLEYTKHLPEDGPLLPGLPKTRLDSKSSAEVSRKFGQLKTKAGVTRDRLSFHSFRKTVTTAFDRVGVPANDVNAVLGWSRGFGFDTYSGGPGLKRLAAIVAKIEYPGLRLPK